MKRSFALAMVFLFAALAGAFGQSLDEQYIQIFNTIQEADNLSATQPGKALAKYAEAQGALQRIQRDSPDWNSKIVTFRLSYIATKINALQSGTPPEPAATNVPTTNSLPTATITNTTSQATNALTTATPNPARPAPAVVLVNPTAELEGQIRALRDQVRQLQGDRIVMEAKLKEALSTQPGETDPGELMRAREKLNALQKENELLKVSLGTEKNKTPTGVDPKALEQAQQALGDANRQLAQQKELVTKLALERDAALNRARSVSAPSSDLTALQAENQLLKQRLAAVSTNAPGPAPATKSEDSSKLVKAQAEIAALQSDKELLRLEKAALENRLKTLSAQTVGSSVLPQTASTDGSVRVKELERERDQLQKKLEAANKSMYGKKGNVTASRVDQIELELSTARARLEVFEARQVPYSAEEQALMKSPETKLAEAQPKSNKRPARDLPSGSAILVREAQTAFASHQYDKAESAYAQVVHMDPKNVPALANYAAVQIEAGHLDEAERSVRTALAEDPEDAYSLYVLGILEFRKTKYDEALDALSRAAKMDPDNAEIQNYLGLALSEKGMRGPAETALRRAVQLQPNYGGAHYNLAIVYSSQQPPAMELARFHYQKAITSGHAPNKELEQKLGRN